MKGQRLEASCGAFLIVDAKGGQQISRGARGHAAREKAFDLSETGMILNRGTHRLHAPGRLESLSGGLSLNGDSDVFPFFLSEFREKSKKGKDSQR